MRDKRKRKSHVELLFMACGAAAGYATADGHLALLTMPAGIVLAGAARGASEALRIVIRNRILNRFYVSSNN